MAGEVFEIDDGHNSAAARDCGVTRGMEIQKSFFGFILDFGLGQILTQHIGRISIPRPRPQPLTVFLLCQPRF
ncbi:MAG TPA: hypothetical protein VGG19_04175 [Tepidisphaeraceae bacterium]